MPRDVLDELKQLTSEQRNPRTMTLDTMSTREILEAMNAEDRTVPDAVARALPEIEKAVELIVAAFHEGGRLIYVGAGTSGRLGILDASECPPTFGTEPHMVQGFIAGGKDSVFRAAEGAEDKFEQAAQDLEVCTLNRSDVVVGISASRRTPYVLGALSYAKSMKSKTILLICNEPPTDTAEAGVLICNEPPTDTAEAGVLARPESSFPPASGGTEGGSASDSPTFTGGQGGDSSAEASVPGRPESASSFIVPHSSLASASLSGFKFQVSDLDILISVPVGPEVLTGSTRLKAGTATKLVLNMLTTAAWVRMGKCYENLMVDLRQGSQKLRARARRIFMELTGSDYERADELLKECQGELKTALIAHWRGVTPDHARDLLADAEGGIRKVKGNS